MAGTSRHARSVRMLFAAYLALNLIAFLLKSPIGSNATRLFAIGGHAAAVAGHERGPSPLAADRVPGAGRGNGAAGRPDGARRLLGLEQPGGRRLLLAARRQFLDHHPSEGYRVEAVATWGHWDAYYLARHVPLARGWYRQDDFPQNQVLYRGQLTAGRLPGMAAQPRRALRAAARHLARLQLPPGGGAAAVGRVRASRSGHSPGTGASTSCRAPTPIVTSPSDEQAALELLEPDRALAARLGPRQLRGASPLQPVLDRHLGTACIAQAADGMMQVLASRGPACCGSRCGREVASVADGRPERRRPAAEQAARTAIFAAGRDDSSSPR